MQQCIPLCTSAFAMKKVRIIGFVPALHRHSEDVFLRLRLFYKDTEDRSELFNHFEEKLLNNVVDIAIKELTLHYAHDLLAKDGSVARIYDAPTPAQALAQAEIFIRSFFPFDGISAYLVDDESK